MKISHLFAAVFALWGSLAGFPGLGSAATLPAGFSEETVGSGWDGVAGVVTGPNADGTKRRVYGWEASGKVWIVENGVRLASPLVDITAEIGPELSLLGFALDPAFQANGYIYLLYTVDRNALLGSPGRAPSVGRLTRYTCRRDSDFTTVDANLRKVLIGETKSTGIPIIERSHGVGALVFAADGTLLVSAGDGAGGSETEIDTGNSPNALQAVADGIIPASLNIGAWRSQSLDSMSGKILRIDPETGDGIAGNPFYQSGNPRSSRSRVWAYGLRNPYRFAIKPGTGSPDRRAARPGTIVLGDAGWNTADSLFVCSGGGQNFGWPAYEGFDPAPGYKDVTPPAFVNTTSRILPVSSWTPTGARVRSAGNIYTMGAPGNPVAGASYTGRASIGGTFIDSTAWPALWAGRYFQMDWGLDDNGSGGWVRSFPGVETGTLPSVDAFGSDWFHVSHLFFDKPSDSLYTIIWPSTVKRVIPPAAVPPGPVDTTPPSLTLYAPAVLDPVQDYVVAMNLSEVVSGLTASDFVVTNGTALSYGPLDGPLTGRLTVRPAGNGIVSVSLPAGVCADAAGNGNAAAAAVTTVVGNPLPPVQPPVVVAGLKMEVFSDPDLKIPAFSTVVNRIENTWGDGGPRPDLTDSFSVRWSGRISSPSIQGMVRKFIVDSDDGIRLYVGGQLLLDSWDQPGIHWQQESGFFLFGQTPPGFWNPTSYDFVLEYRDLTGLAVASVFWAGETGLPTAPTGFFHIIGTPDTVPPKAVLEAPAVTSSVPVSVNAVFSEDVGGLTMEDFLVAGGAARTLNRLSASRYELLIGPASPNAMVTVTLPAGSYFDLRGNAGTASNPIAISYEEAPDPNPLPGVRATYITSANDTPYPTVVAKIDDRRNTGTTGYSPLNRDNQYYKTVYAGRIRPAYSEDYRLIVDADDKVRLFLDGVLLIDNWGDAAVPAWQLTSPPVRLEAGQLHRFRLEFQQFALDSVVTLFWKSARQSFEVVPASALFQPHPAADPSLPPAFNISTNPTGTGRSGIPSIAGLMYCLVEASTDVTGLEPGDFILRNARIASFSQTEPDQWAIWLAPLSPGFVSLSLPPGAGFGPTGVPSLGAAEGGSNRTVIYELAAADAPPVIGNPGPQKNFAGVSVSLPLQADDVEGDVLVEASGLPPGISCYHSYGKFTLAGHLPSTPGTWHVLLTASDHLRSVTTSFVWTTQAASPDDGAWQAVVATMPEIGRSLNLDRSGTALTLRWSCPAAAQSRLIVESSANLTDWQIEPVTGLTSSVADGSGMMQCALPLVSGTGSRYYRLKAVR